MLDHPPKRVCRSPRSRPGRQHVDDSAPPTTGRGNNHQGGARGIARVLAGCVSDKSHSERSPPVPPQITTTHPTPSTLYNSDDGATSTVDEGDGALNNIPIPFDDSGGAEKDDNKGNGIYSIYIVEPN
jgi:hypothetical protein